MYNSPKLETIQMPNNSRTDTLLYSYNGILYRTENE